MKYSLLTLCCLVSIFLIFELSLSDGKKYGKSSSKSSSKGTNIMKEATKPRNVVGAVVGGYVAHKVMKKVVKKPKIKIGGGGFGSDLLLMSMMVSGPGWGVRPYHSRYYFTRPISQIFVHHTGTEDCYELSTCAAILQKMQQQRMDVEGLPDIGYNFMIGGDGRIYEGLGWSSYGHYRPVLGEDSIAVAFIGDFSIYRPNDAQLDAFQRLIRYGDDKDLLKSYRIHGHRDVACTTCPGDALYAWIRTMGRYRSLAPVDCSFINTNVNQTIIERF